MTVRKGLEICFYFLSCFPFLFWLSGWICIFWQCWGGGKNVKKEDVECILKWAVRNWFDISDKGKGYCTQLFSSYHLTPFLVNHNRNQRNSSSWLASPMHTVSLAGELDSAYGHQPHSAGCAWHLGTSVLTSVPWAPGKQPGQFRGSPSLSPHDLFPPFFPRVRSAYSFTLVSCKETLILKWTLLADLLQKFQITDLEPSA